MYNTINLGKSRTRFLALLIILANITNFRRQGVVVSDFLRCVVVVI